MISNIENARPVGSLVLVELLTAKEAYGTMLEIQEEAKLEIPQGYVLDVGPLVPDMYGIKKGDRVFLSGSVTPVPKYGDNVRNKVMLDYHLIKGVLHETGTGNGNNHLCVPLKDEKDTTPASSCCE